METKSFEGWAIVEVMGHQKFAGYCSDQAVGGAAMLRVEVPAVDGHAAFSKLFATGALYAITPVAEDVARSMAKELRKSPVSIYEFPDEVVSAMRAAARGLPGPTHDECDYDQSDLYADDIEE